MRFWAGAVAAAMLVLVPAGFAGTPQDVNFAETVFASGLSQITGIAWATDGSNTLFVSQKTGQVRVIRNGTLQAANFSTDTVITSSECGLDNVIVDPSYSSNKYVYLFASVNNSTQQVLRYTAVVDGSGNLVGQSRTKIGPDLPTVAANHDGGGMAIGADGFLYVGIGNNGNGTNAGGDGTASEWTSLGSKIIRMDRFSGAAVSTNPWYQSGSPSSAQSYMFAKGFRNPFGLRMRPGTNDLWLTEVGDGWEQIFLVTAGSRQGWPTENNTTDSTKLMPKLAYQTNVSTFGGCLTRGAFYTASAFPSQYMNNLFFCDYNSGKLMRSVLDSTLKNINSTSVFVTGNSSLTDAGVGPDGALYYCSHGGTIYKLRYTGTGTQNIITSATSMNVNEGSSAGFTVRLAIAPAANVTVSVARSSGDTDVSPSPTSLTFTPSNWNTPQTVTVSAAQDPDSSNDGATITCSSSGLTSQNVTITVIDDDVVNGAPTARITQPRNGDVVSGATAEFYGDGIDDVGTVKAEFYVDGVLKYSDTAAGGHYHINGDHGRWDTTSLSNGTHTLKMTVYDGGGLSGSHQITVTVDNSGPSTGLLAQYYDNIDLTGLKITRSDPTVDFDWGSGSPDPTIGVDSFSIRWSGQVQPQFGETYTFFTTSDDGVRLWVNNVLLIDKWVDQGPTEWSGTIALAAGQRYDLKMEYYENGGGAVAKLSWSSPSTAKQIIPQARLFPGGSLPSPWQNRDIGSVGTAGSSSYSGGTFTVKGSGADIWNTLDEFQFVYQALNGDGTVTARVTAVQNTNVWAKAGVMIREGLSDAARHAMMVITPGSGASFQRRVAVGGASASTAGPVVVAPYWVRVVRSGSTLTGSVSTDGSTWTLVGSDTIALSSSAMVGLAVTSHSDGVLCSATFTNVSVSGVGFKQDPGPDGLVSIEVENFDGKLDQGGHTWSATTPAGSSGTALQATPNTGINQDTGYAANSPRLDYKVNFVKTGLHHVWIRGIGATGSDDSIHAGLDGAESTTSDRISSFGTAWTWSRDTMDGVSATINVTSAGIHTLNLWMREDGFVVDKVVLSSNVNYVPSGTGPAQSPR
ncbi:MAG: PQQ-dependent sugar dehydrogenase [Planctomycetes bacterium]|nr:PQQ-dependent sugar dehydrogenase [Planctomycetota bacterium]